MKKVFVLIFIVLFEVAGCAQYSWQKYGATRDDFNKDVYDCNMAAAQTFPPLLVEQPIGSGTPEQTHCISSGHARYGNGNISGNSNTDCTTYPASKPVTVTLDQNQYSRGKAAEQCMYARGWNKVRGN